MMKSNKRQMGTVIGGSENPFIVSKVEKVVTEYNIFLHGDITDPSDFIEALHALNQAEEHDIVNLHIQSGGGSLDATDALLDAINSCQAPVYAKVTGCACSAATMVLLACDGFQISPNTVMMVHSASLGYSGKVGAVHDYIAFQKKQIDKLVRDTYGAMFTEEEYVQMDAGKDFWMTPEEFCERWKRMQEALGESEQEEVHSLQ